MSKTIRVNLSPSSIEKAIAEIQEYKQQLQFKCSIFVQRLADLGIQTIEEHKYSKGDSDFNDLHEYVWLDYRKSSVKATLVLSGKDVAFIEFGAGVHYNGVGGSSPNPYGQPLGMAIGSYGKGKGLDDYWYYFDEEQGRFVTSHGTEAAMPMYYADRKIIKQFVDVAKEVFAS